MCMTEIKIIFLLLQKVKIVFMLPLFSICVCMCVCLSACFCVLLCTINCYFLKMPQNKVDGICLQEAQNLWGEICIFKDACSAAQSYLTLSDPMGCIQPGSSAHGIFQARKMEWVAIFSSRGSSQPRGQTCVFCISCIGRQIRYH